VLGIYNVSCVFDVDDDIVCGGGIVFVIVGMGGMVLCNINISDVECFYFCVFLVVNFDFFYGVFDVVVDVMSFSVSFLFFIGVFVDFFVIWMLILGN